MTVPARASRATRYLVLALVVALVLAACTGSTQTTDTSGAPTSSVAPDAGNAGEPGNAGTTAGSDQPDEPQPPDEPEILPVGTWWEPVSTEGDVGFGPLVVVGEELWSLGRRLNAPVVHRTTDGVDWEPISMVAPPSRGAIELSGILARPDGGYLAWGSRQTRCQAAEDAGDGFVFVGLCRRFQPMIFLSDDGVTWRSIEPSGLAAPSGSSSLLAGVIVDPNGGYLAAGTVRGPDWHARVWRSDDGETWSLVREVRGADGPTSAEQFLTDGSSILLVVNEHPCSVPSDNTPGWILGSGWARHPRLYLGTSADDLTLQTPGDHPLAAAPMAVDCATQTGYDLKKEPYTEASGTTLGGTLVVAGRPPRPSKEEPKPDLQVWSYQGGAWVDISPHPTDKQVLDVSQMIDVNGMPGFVGTSPSLPHSFSIVALLPDGDGGLSTSDGRPVGGERLSDAVWFAGGLYASGFGYFDPFAERDPVDPLRQEVWRSVAISVDDLPRCELVAGAVCEFVHAREHPDYPDLTGIDLSGTVLRWADFGDANLTGADFTGADLSGASIGRALIDADFTGASLRGATVDDGAGAVFTGTDLTGASIELTAAPASLDDAILRGAAVSVRDDDGPDIELDLSDLDLTGASFRDPFSGGARLIITDLRGAIIDNTTFYQVDLSQVDVEGVDLSSIYVSGDSICPDGLPPEDNPSGGCVRAG